MHAVDVDHFRGRMTAATLQELDAVLGLRGPRGDNCFWISATGAEHPTLGIVVRGADAALTYLLREDDPGWQSAGLCSDGPDVEFTISLSGELIWFDHATVVPWDTGRQAAEEFAHTLARPSCLSWTAL